MARTMDKDADLYRVVVKAKAGWTTYYGPYDDIGVARGQRTRMTTDYWNQNRYESVHVEVLTASRDPFGFPELLWERLDD